MLDLQFAINACEIARDYEDPHADLLELLRKHFCHPYQRQPYRATYRNTHYDGPGHVRCKFVHYPDYSNPGCYHSEWRLRSPETLRRAGINELVDVTGFDFDRFWDGHLQLRSIDWNQLGRYCDLSQAKRQLRANEGVVQKLMYVLKDRIPAGRRRDRVFSLQRPKPRRRGWGLEQICADE
jgi:hypothetical protein